MLHAYTALNILLSPRPSAIQWGLETKTKRKKAIRSTLKFLFLILNQFLVVSVSFFTFFSLILEFIPLRNLILRMPPAYNWLLWWHWFRAHLKMTEITHSSKETKQEKVLATAIWFRKNVSMGNVLGRGWCCRQWVCHSPDGFHYCCNAPLHEKTGPNDRLAYFVGVVVLLFARGHSDGNSLVYEVSTCLQMVQFFLGVTHASHLGARESWQCCDLLSKFCSSAAMAKDTGFYQPRKLCSIGECKVHSPACLLAFFIIILF